ncbi:MAG: anhydro-N-acetylmuramic acid kinase [Bacteroidetes bacterium CG2_30_32_10]|nr:MAG: anhydro-N-acetylmuramic acid kinase [Bacteroidetes bacterium CG2_30_32_10]
MEEYNVIGVMSGTSLDGVDIAYCKLSKLDNKWHYRIEKAVTYKYTEEWISKLSNLEKESTFNFVKTHIEYGHYLGKLIKAFIDDNFLMIDFVASHGHTIFHQTEKQITCQIGDGASIAAETKGIVVCDFRTLDVALGGQGAPLVPIGDKILFNDYDFCLNLGGFSNISFDLNNERRAYDICPTNIILNYLANKLNMNFDCSGKIAEQGIINNALLTELNNLEYYKKTFPKSLGKEWLYNIFIPIIEKYTESIENKLRTVTEHIVIQLNIATNFTKNKKILITGGGAYNEFLIRRLSSLTSHQIIIPDSKTIEFKEALVFALLGILRIKKEINCLKSVTGAANDSIGGAVYYGL